MFNFLKRKKNGLLNRVKYISKNKSMNFQMNVYKNENLDFQMTRKDSLKKFNFTINNSFLNNDIVYFLTFGSDRDKAEGIEERFLSSSLYKESEKVDLLGGTYLIFSKNDYSSIIQKINQIGKEIYRYDYNESGVNFNEI